MSKIININESDLKKIVKKVLTERQQIDEILLTSLALYAAGTYLAAGVLSSLFGSGREGLDLLEKDCGNTKLMGKKTQPDSEIVRIVYELDKAAPSSEGVKSYITNSDEEGIGIALAKIKSIPDFCAVNKKFKEETRGNLIDNIDSAFKYDTWYAGTQSWDKYVYNPLKNAINFTKRANEKVKSDSSKDNTDVSVKDSGGGSTGGGDVAELQSILKNRGYDIGSHGVDGKFGQDTLDAVLKALKSSK
jgi:hypothetical protein